MRFGRLLRVNTKQVGLCKITQQMESISAMRRYLYTICTTLLRRLKYLVVLDEQLLIFNCLWLCASPRVNSWAERDETNFKKPSVVVVTGQGHSL